MAGCPLLWLLSVGQATESNSPTGEKTLSLSNVLLHQHTITFNKKGHASAWPFSNIEQCRNYFLANEGFVAIYDFTPDKIAFTNLSW